MEFVDARGGSNRDIGSWKRRVTAAFEKIWDGSEAHAAAVAQIIRDLAYLKPTKEFKKRFGDRKRT
jgi:hypothetical protein